MSEHTIEENDGDIRLDRWFKRHYPGVPHSMIEKHLRKGLIRLDGKKAKSSDRVQAGQVIGIRVQLPDAGKEKKPPPPATRHLSPDDERLMHDAVLYKDAHVIVLNKPAGLAVQGGSKVTKSIDGLLDALRFDARERPKLTHRLDRDTSGVLVLARSAKVATQLMRAFSGKHVEKTYLALVNGCPLDFKGVIDLPLSKAADGERELVGVDEEEGKRAITEYRVLESLVRKFALMELKPLTGRTHQLRVHMAEIGCPIVGDHKYGGGNTDAQSLGVQNILHLHARRIVIPMPAGKSVDVTAPLPKHMKQSFKALGIEI